MIFISIMLFFALFLSICGVISMFEEDWKESTYIWHITVIILWIVCISETMFIYFKKYNY